MFICMSVCVHMCVSVCVCVLYNQRVYFGFSDRFLVKHKEGRDSSSLTDPYKSSSTCTLHMHMRTCSMCMDRVCKLQEGGKRRADCDRKYANEDFQKELSVAVMNQ